MDEYLDCLKAEMFSRKDMSFNQSLLNCTLSKSSIQKSIHRANGICQDKDESKFEFYIFT